MLAGEQVSFVEDSEDRNRQFSQYILGKVSASTEPLSVARMVNFVKKFYLIVYWRQGHFKMSTVNIAYVKQLKKAVIHGFECAYLTGHCQRVAQLSLSCAELPKHLCNGPRFNTP